MKKTITIFFFILICSLFLYAQENETKIPSLQNEKWWGAFVAKGSVMPWKDTPTLLDLHNQNFNNQTMPLFLSDKGRYIWCEKPFQFTVKDGDIYIKTAPQNIEIVNGGSTLREAYLAASRSHFPPSGKLPDTLFFSMPQYNTWIELMYNQNQQDILDYAANILRNDFPTGVLMIDDNWQKYYGNFDFKPEKFPNPQAMVAQLHKQGFKVMLWVCPFVSPDSPEFRELESKGYLLKKKGSHETALIHWWNGFSACYDLTHPQAFDHFIKQLKTVQEKYGIDGFKLDAGDVAYLSGTSFDSYQKDALCVDHSQKWAEVGLHFPFNEYRACWKMGNQPLVQRLGDKDYSWNALKLLIPDMLTAGLLGYSFTCPDMIGGGQNSAFLNVGKFDELLIVRSTQVHTLMPMMQFSVAPWRILNESNLAICRDMAKLHVKMGPYLLKYARHSAQTGEPIVRHMEYEFPHQGFSDCKDQFMLGEKYLVAPMLTPDAGRTVRLPKGKWKDDSGKIIHGGKTIDITVAPDRLPYFEKIK